MKSAFKELIENAVHDPTLTGALGRFSETYLGSRAKAYEGVDFEAVRTQIAAVKGGRREASRRIGGRIQEKRRGARREGLPRQHSETGQGLHPATGPGQRRVEFIVKSKSMASEEIHLNKHLEAEGIHVSRPTWASGSSSLWDNALRTW